MSVYVELSLDPSAFSLRERLPLPPGITLEFEPLVPVGDAVFPLIRVTGGDPDQAVSVIRSLVSVDDVRVVESSGDETLLRVSWSAEFSDFIDGVRAADGAVLSARGDRDSWQVALRFPDHAALTRFRDVCRDRDIGYTVERIDRQGPDPGEVGLQPKQEQTLRLALSRGYFDVPRDVTLQELADELGVSDQSVSERLRRGIETIVDESLTEE